MIILILLNIGNTSRLTLSFIISVGVISITTSIIIRLLQVLLMLSKHYLHQNGKKLEKIAKHRDFQDF